MSIRMTGLLLGAACATLGLAGSGAARPAAAVSLNGTATIKSFDLLKNCSGSVSANKKTFIVRCTQMGVYAGKAGPAGASYGWEWKLAVNASGSTSGHGTERGTLILNFGGPGLLYLSLSGKQAPVGKASATKAKGLTRGTWTMTKGTASLAGKHGRGTYTFTTARTGSQTVFSLARLALTGSIS